MTTMLHALCLLLALALTVLPPSALAWGKTGHRVTGVIAEPYLSPAARSAIASILGAEDLAEASNWPDFMRASPEGIWPEKANPWHYVTIPRGKSYGQVNAPGEGDAITALAEFRATLKDPDASADDKALALRFTVHLIGDLHQPLHAGNGSDRGGNDFRVTFFGADTNLHSVWDSHLIDHEQLSFTEMADWLGRTITSKQVQAWQQAGPAEWADESAAMRDQIYPKDRDLRWDYIFEHRAKYRQRLQQAGVRMAGYLNAVFAP